jgi:hypothetical protein
MNGFIAILVVASFGDQTNPPAAERCGGRGDTFLYLRAAIFENPLRPFLRPSEAR